MIQNHRHRSLEEDTGYFSDWKKKSFLKDAAQSFFYCGVTLVGSIKMLVFLVIWGLKQFFQIILKAHTTVGLLLNSKHDG